MEMVLLVFVLLLLLLLLLFVFCVDGDVVVVVIFVDVSPCSGFRGVFWKAGCVNEISLSNFVDSSRMFLSCVFNFLILSSVTVMLVEIIKASNESVVATS